MKPLVIIIGAIFLCCFSTGTGQVIMTVTTIPPMQYSADANARLQTSVDSVNSVFQNRTSLNYSSLPQCHAHSIRVDGNNTGRILADIRSGITWDALKKKYPRLNFVEDNLLWLEKDTQNDTILNVNGYECSFAAVNRRVPPKGSWVTSEDQHPKKEECYYLEACYLTKGFVAIPFKPEYSRIIGYLDCFVSTSRSRLKFGRSGFILRIASPPALKSIAVRFDNWLATFSSGPGFDDLKYRWDDVKYKQAYGDWCRQYMAWDSARSEHLLKQDGFRRLIDTIALKNGKMEEICVDDEQENFLLRCGYRDVVMASLRYKHKCFDYEDVNPSIIRLRHLVYLAAELGCWDIFIEAQFYLARRGSEDAVRQLEELHINVTDLLIGSILYPELPGLHRYASEEFVVGNALKLVRDSTSVGIRLLDMIADTTLDMHSRIRLSGVYLSYVMTPGRENTPEQTQQLEKMFVLTTDFPKQFLRQVKLLYLNHE